jgi:PAS domain S-box-containing protein
MQQSVLLNAKLASNGQFYGIFDPDHVLCISMELEERYAKLINYLTDYIYTVRIRDGVAVETYHGPGCVSITGYTSEDYRSNPDLWYRMVPRGDREKVLDQAQRALSGQQVSPLEHRIIHRDCTTRWIRNTIVVTKDESGVPVAYDGLINDITQLKKAEAAEAIRQQQLIQADKMASLGTLVSGIAHEMNNPNNFILLNARLFQRIWTDILPVLDEYHRNNGDYSIAGMPYSSSRGKLIQSLDNILQGSERIQNITRSLTEYARKDGGQLNDPVEINRVVSMAIAITDTLINQSTTNFRVDYTPNMPVIRGNAQQLEQVIINLITNACQSLADKTDEIRIKTYYSGESNEVGVIVKDSGSGIRESDLKYIMDPFFTTKRDRGGTGLGLSVSYNIVKSHGGSLVLTSERNRGTKAKVALPVLQPE